MIALCFALSLSTVFCAESLPWDPERDTGCGYRHAGLEAADIADWIECQIKTYPEAQ